MNHDGETNHAGGGPAETGNVLHATLQRLGPAVFVAIGCLVFVLGMLLFARAGSIEMILSPFGLFHVAFYGALGGVIVICGVLFIRGDIPSGRLPRALGWVVAAMAFLLLINAPIMLALRNFMEGPFLLGWIMSVSSTGASAGSVVGLVEARSIERARANQQLASEREAAREHAEQLEYLNSVIRHEVLNNVSIIKGYAEIALEDQGSEAVPELDVILSQSREMANVITEVRVLIQTIQDVYTLEPRNLSAVLDDELAKVRTTFDDPIEVDAGIPDGVDVMADDLLPRIFGNLLSNAVEYNDSPAPRIEVTVEATADEVVVYLADNGPGIPERERETLFERADGADHGLGLYLVGELVDRYDGDIELAETGPDGTVFAVTLHRAGPTDAPRETEQAQARASSPANVIAGEIQSD